jgi:hypothetical protein
MGNMYVCICEQQKWEHLKPLMEYTQLGRQCIYLFNNIVEEITNDQNLILFIQGSAVCGASTIKGTNPSPKPPVKTYWKI